MARRLYIGRLPPDARSEDMSKLFDGYGRIADVRVMTGFGFVEFENSRDAEDAVNALNGKSFMGTNLVIEFAKESRPRRDPYEAPRTRRPPGFRVTVSGVSRDTSWQDLKDFGREGGNVSFADIDRDNPGDGILEYTTRDEAERAVKDLDGKELRGRSVRVTMDERGGADNYRRDDRRPPRDDRDRYRDDRGYGGRARSRSPGRDDRGHGRRSRSPPRYDDRRRSPRRDHDDRRGGHDDRRDDRRGDREDRRRDDREDRPPRPSTSEAGGYSRSG